MKLKDYIKKEYGIKWYWIKFRLLFNREHQKEKKIIRDKLK